MSTKQIGAADGDSQTESDADECELSTDQIFHILQNERRRNVLRYLQDTDGPVRMRDVAEQVAAWEHDTTVEALSSDQRQRVYIPLYQSHLPKLDKAGIIEYQKSRGIVERRPLADRLDPYLDPDVNDDPSTDDRQSEWDDYYIGAAGTGAIMLLGAVLELPIFSIMSGIGLSAIILLMFTLLTASRHART